jgi:hypothetical protein
MNRPTLYGAVAVATALAFAPAAIAQMAPAAGWSAYSNAEYHVAVETPSAPAIKTAVASRPDGQMPNLHGTVIVGDDTVMVFVVDDMSHLAIGATPDAALDQAVQGATMGRTVDKTSNVAVRGAPGREVLVHDDTHTYRMKMFFAGGRRYMAVEVAPKGVIHGEFDRFAASLRAT